MSELIKRAREIYNLLDHDVERYGARFDGEYADEPIPNWTVHRALAVSNIISELINALEPSYEGTVGHAEERSITELDLRGMTYEEMYETVMNLEIIPAEDPLQEGILKRILLPDGSVMTLHNGPIPVTRTDLSHVWPADGYPYFGASK